MFRRISGFVMIALMFSLFCLVLPASGREMGENVLTVTPLYSRHEVLVDLNIRGYRGDPADLYAVVRLEAGHSDPLVPLTLEETEVREFRRGFASVSFSIEDYFSGEYKISVDMFDDDRMVFSNEEKFQIIERPEWLEERVGIEALSDDTVLPPFDPVRVSRGNRVEVWNRSYTVGNLGLPSGITTEDASILAGPVTLSLVSGGRDVLARLKGPALVNQAEGAVEYAVEGEAGKGRVTVRTRIEFDGLYLYTIEIDPRGSLQLESLTLKVPLKAEYVDYLYASGEPSERTTDGPLILDRGMSMALSSEGQQWKSPFKESIWLGDDERGLTWYCPSEENWHPQEYSQRKDAMKVVKKEGAVILTVDFINGPYELIAPAEYNFAFMPTPIRPKPDGWRGWKITTYDPSVYESEMHHGQKGNMLVYWPAPLWEHYNQSPVIRDEELYRESAESDRAEGRAVLPYLAPQLKGLGLHSIDLTAWQEREKGQQSDFLFRGEFDSDDAEWKVKDPYIGYFAHEWQLLPERFLHVRRGDYHSPVLYVCPMSNWTDYALWLMREHARLGADGIGILDGVSGTCENQLHGCGYVNERGEVRPTYWGMGARDMAKRLLYMFEEERGDERSNLITGLGMDHLHAFNPLKAVLSGSFFDAGQKGEELNSGYFLGDPEYRAKIRKSDYYYANMLTLETFRIEYGHQWGWVPVFFPQLKKSPGISSEWADSREGAKDFLVLTLLHDVLVWPIWCNPYEVLDTYKARDRFGIAEWDVEFFPYYANSEYASASCDDVEVSFYRRPGKVLVIVSNLATEPREADVFFDLQKTGAVRGGFRAYDGITEEPVDFDGKRMSFSFPPRDYRMIIIEQN